MKEYNMNQTLLDPRLYIIMREDLQDMNPGKGMAQAAHAQADMLAYTVDRTVGQADWHNALIAWMGTDREFGTTLVLSAPKAEFENISKIARHSGYTTDPTYPWRNWYGKVFLSSEVTCMWAFVWEPDEIKAMHAYKLHE
jgi:peptidyl-tRNA hydrolase